MPDEVSRGGTARPARLWAAAPEVDPFTYQSLLKALPDMALLVFDRDLRVRLAVSGALTSPAWPRELVGRMVWEVLATERSQQALEHCRAALAGTGGPVELSVDGLVWRGEVVPVLDAAGAVTGGLVVAVDDGLRPPREREALRDITARKQTEEALALAHAELQQRTADLERVNVDLESFAYAAAHDLKEPLRAIAGYATLLARQYGGRLDADADGFLTYLVEGAGRMRALIEDLLAYAQVDGDQQQFEPVDAAKAAEEAIANLSALVGEAGATVTRGSLPVVAGDRVQLTQVFQNLVANAVKFHSQRPPAIHLSAQRRERAWCFSVADNGIGIDPAHNERVFGMLQRLHGRNQYAGTGIGLATCKRIVERHGGRIWVDPTDGGGSTFRFTVTDQAGTRVAGGSAGQLGGQKNSSAMPSGSRKLTPDP